MPPSSMCYGGYTVTRGTEWVTAPITNFIPVLTVSKATNNMYKRSNVRISVTFGSFR